jgi:tRNA (cytidine/uridine-2'-O-)-methyltransferase
MPLHIALLETLPAPTVGAIARCCQAVDASLHLVGALGFEAGDPAVLEAGPEDWDALDWWHHPEWKDFRGAMSRERCLYFAIDGEHDPIEAPFRPNSVLVFGDMHLELPQRIREKYPDRIYALPRAVRGNSPGLPRAIEVTLAFAAKRLEATARPGGAAPRARSRRR